MNNTTAVAMKLITEAKGFKEVIKEYDNYDREAVFTRDAIPEGCALRATPREEYMSVEVYRYHPFNAEVTAARAAMVAAHNARSDSYPTVKFVIDGWTPVKLAEMQGKVAERVTAYKAATVRIEATIRTYNAALEAQRLEILGGTT
jgi:hypothetical protein